MGFGSTAVFWRYAAVNFCRTAAYVGFGVGIYYLAYSLVNGLRFLALGLTLILLVVDLIAITFLARAKFHTFREKYSFYAVFFIGLHLTFGGLIMTYFVFTTSFDYQWNRQPVANNISVSDIANYSTFDIFFFSDGVIDSFYSGSSSWTAKGQTTYVVVAPLTSQGPLPICAWVVYRDGDNDSPPDFWDKPYHQAIRNYGSMGVQEAIAKAKSKYNLTSSADADRTILSWVNFTESYRSSKNTAHGVLGGYLFIAIFFGLVLPMIVLTVMFYCCCCWKRLDWLTDMTSEITPLIHDAKTATTTVN